MATTTTMSGVRELTVRAIVVGGLINPESGRHHRRDLPCRAVLLGCVDPTEVLTAWEESASAVKIFPASIGGPDCLRAIAAPLPGIPLMPTGGIGLAQVPDYIRAGAIAVGVGGPLLRDAPDPNGDLNALGSRARALVESLGATLARAETN